MCLSVKTWIILLFMWQKVICQVFAGPTLHHHVFFAYVDRAQTSVHAAKSRVRTQPLGGRTVLHSVAKTTKLISWYLPPLCSKLSWLQTDVRSRRLSRSFVGDVRANFKEFLCLQPPDLFSFTHSVDLSYWMNGNIS